MIQVPFVFTLMIKNCSLHSELNFQTKLSDGAANTEKITEGNLEEGDGDGSNGAGAQQSSEEVHSPQQGKATTFCAIDNFYAKLHCVFKVL